MQKKLVEKTAHITKMRIFKIGRNSFYAKIYPCQNDHFGATIKIAKYMAKATQIRDVICKEKARKDN